VTGAYILTGFSVGDVSLRSTPNQGLRNTVRAFIQFIVYVGIFTIFFGAGWAAMGLSADRAILAWIGIVIFFSLGDTVISHGGMPITQHLWLRYQLERRGQIPRNMARFLDHASSLILMRKVGGGYIFVHRYLLEYFAELETKGGEVST
jgi:pilus assembly protein TadC